MRVEIIDERRQRFNGLTYHRNGWGYFIYKSRPLHRVVWEYHNGKIPKGYDIHHIDGDKSNNQIENLQCLTRKEHRRLHVEMDRANGLIATPAKKYFICQKCGKEFSSTLDDPKFCYACRAKPKPEHVVKPFKPRRFRTCIACGKPFLLTPEKRRGQHRTCSPQCHAKVYPAPIPEKICPICGKLFKGVHSSQKTCSVECGIKFNAQRQIKRVTSICIWCGKEFSHVPSLAPSFCSRACADTFRALTQRKDVKANQELRQCTHCGKTFLACKSTRKSFCSKECREESKKRPCPICGKIFIPRSKFQKTCSHRCGTFMQNLQHKR